MVDTKYTRNPLDFYNLQKTDYWTFTNTYAYYPRPGNRNTYSDETLRYRDASFVRLQYVSLSWSLPKRWIDSFRMKQLKVYITAQNLGLFTDLQQNDPEGSTTMWSVPATTTWLMDVHLGI